MYTLEENEAYNGVKREEFHQKYLDRLNEVGEEQFRQEAWDGKFNLGDMLAYIHPSEDLKELEKFKIIQDAFIRSVV